MCCGEIVLKFSSLSSSPWLHERLEISLLKQSFNPTAKDKDQPVNHKDSSEIVCFQSLVFSRNVSQTSSFYHQEVKSNTSTSCVCLQINWKDTKQITGRFFFFFFFNQNKSRLQIHLLRPYLNRQLTDSHHTVLSTQSGTKQPFTDVLRWHVMLTK
jgi:hypothetical protein